MHLTYCKLTYAHAACHKMSKAAILLSNYKKKTDNTVFSLFQKTIMADKEIYQ